MAAENPGSATGAPDPAALYGHSYYARYYVEGGERIPYGRTDQWLAVFGSFADRIVAEIGPASALDVGCALGLLVEALRDRGVEASGFDVSDYAISQVREDVRSHCWVGSALDPIPGRYDLVTCVEVLEHLPAEEVDGAVANICGVTDDVLFSSTSGDYGEETHLNVRPLEYWTGLFAGHGFVRDLGFDGSFITPWTVRYRRARDPWPRLVIDYDREHWRLSREARARNALVLSQLERIGALEAEIAGLRASTQATELERWRAEVALSRARAVELQAEVDRVHAEQRGSVLLRAAARGRRAMQRAAPEGSRRRRVTAAVARMLSGDSGTPPGS